MRHHLALAVFCAAFSLVTPVLAAPTIATVASAGVTLGGAINDTATIAGGVSPTGTVTFTLYGPNDATCANAPTFTDVQVVTGNGSFPSSSVTPSMAGVYLWIARYNGDSNNNPVSGNCNDANETVTIAPATITWIGGDSNWSTPTNWDLGRAPQNGDDVVISTIGSTPINQDLSGLTVHSLTDSDIGVMFNILGSPLGLQSGGTINGGMGGDLIIATGLGLNGPAVIGGGFVTFNSAITGTGGITLNSSFAELFGTNTYSGPTTIATGVTRTFAGGIPAGSAVTVTGNLDLLGTTLTIGSLSGSGVVDVGLGSVSYPDSTLTVGGDNTSTTFSGVYRHLLSVGSLVKVGTGTFTLSGANTYTGVTNVNAGRLDVNGSIVSATTVNAGGTLGGTGTINAPVNVNVGGVLSPGAGASTGILATGNLTFVAGSALAVAINGTTAGTQYDQVQVSGNATLGSASLQVTFGFTPSAGQTFTIVNIAGGALSGTFSITSPSGVVVVPTYNATNVVLTVLAVPPGAPTIGTATPGNGRATIAFTAPASNGGSAITGYTATCNPGNITAPGGAAATSIIVTGLTNSTPYVCSVTATNVAGTGPASGTVGVTPVAPAVTTFSGASATGTGTITASLAGGGAGCSFSAPQFIGAPPGTAPIPATTPGPRIVFAHGLFDFSATGCTVGSTVTFTVTYPTSIAGATFWKYGPTVGNPAHWYVMPATIVGNTATFSITDGGLGDDDLTANGTIVDPVGPGLGTAIPTLSEWMLALLAFAMLGSAAQYYARQRQ